MRHKFLAPLTIEQYGTVTARLPLADVRVLRQRTQIGPRLRAIVDTGAAVTLARLSTARLLGLTDAELDAGPSLTVAGMGGRPTTARGVRLDLSIGPTRNDGIDLAATWVFFADTTLPSGLALLLGQHDALERLTFVQIADERRFVLRFPGD